MEKLLLDSWVLYLRRTQQQHLLASERRTQNRSNSQQPHGRKRPRPQTVSRGHENQRMTVKVDQCKHSIKTSVTPHSTQHRAIIAVPMADLALQQHIISNHRSSSTHKVSLDNCSVKNSSFPVETKIVLNNLLGSAV